MQKCYCPFCGTINHLRNKRCIKCDSKLKPYDQDLVRLIYDQAEGDIRGGIVSAILAFLQTHTYGMILTITLIAVVVPNVILTSQENGHNVTSKPSILLTQETNIKKYYTSKEIMLDFMKDLTSFKNLDDYLYENYFEIDKEKYHNNLDRLNEVLKKKEANNQDYYLEFARHHYENADQEEVYRYGVGIEEEYKYIEAVDMIMVYVYNCTDEECKGDEGINNSPNSPTDWFYLHFVKRNGNWYFYQISDDTADCLVDDEYYYYIKDGKESRYPSIKEAYEMQQQTN